VSILPHLLEWGTHKPEEAVSKESWRKAFLNTPSPLPAWLRCPSSFCLGDFLRWRRVNSGSRRDGGGGRKWSSRAATGRRWRSKNDGPMGKGGGGMDKTQGVGGGREIKREEGRGCQWGALCLASSGGTRSWRGAAGDCYRGGDNGDNKGGGTDKKLVDLANVRRKETRED
jgi:hypothetical protein